MAVSEQVQETLRVIKARVTERPRIGIILGTGLSKLLDEVTDSSAISYSELPGMPKPTAPTHRGRLVFGKMAGKSVVIMDGRFHLYEGYTAREVAYPVWVMKGLGVGTLLVSNVAGSLNPQFQTGELMLVTDHINLLGASPLIGPNEDHLGPRFPDMSQPYDPRLMSLAEQVAAEERLGLRRGVYAAMLGPQLETKAEYRWLRTIGADAVGMSTVPEVIAAVHSGLRVLAVSIISDLCIPETLKPLTIEEVVEVATKAEPLLTKLFMKVVERLS